MRGWVAIVAVPRAVVLAGLVAVIYAAFDELFPKIQAALAAGETVTMEVS